MMYFTLHLTLCGVASQELGLGGFIDIGKNGISVGGLAHKEAHHRLGQIPE